MCKLRTIVAIILIFLPYSDMKKDSNYRNLHCFNYRIPRFWSVLLGGDQQKGLLTTLMD